MKLTLIVLLTLVLIAVISLTAHAADTTSLPDAPTMVIHAALSSNTLGTLQNAHSVTEQHFNRNLFITEVAGFAIADLADGLSTARDTRWGYKEETAYEFGQHPTAARYFITSGIIDGAQAFMAYKLEHSHSRVMRLAGHGIMVAGIGIHASSFGLNVTRLHGRFVGNQ